MLSKIETLGMTFMGLSYEMEKLKIRRFEVGMKS